MIARCARLRAPAALAIVLLLPPLWSFAQSPVFRERIDLVNLGVVVTDQKGQLVGSLSADDFVVLEDGKPQTVRLFAAGGGEGPALHIGVLLDVSESMGEDIAFTRTAAIKFLNTLSEAEDVTLVDFDNEVRVARFDQRSFARLVERIRGQKIGGSTALYDAIGVYIDGTNDQDGRKIMLLYTDGGDTRSALKFGDVMELLKASDITVYGIGAMPRRGSSGRVESRMILQQIAEVTGGTTFFPDTVKQLDRIYDQIVTEIRAQYTIGYQSTNENADGAWRKVEVKVSGRDREGLRIRSRRGYYGPSRDVPAR